MAGGIALAVAAATFGRTTLLQALSDLDESSRAGCCSPGSASQPP
jgi:hypothetical protein